MSARTWNGLYLKYKSFSVESEIVFYESAIVCSDLVFSWLWIRLTDAEFIPTWDRCRHGLYVKRSLVEVCRIESLFLCSMYTYLNSSRCNPTSYSTNAVFPSGLENCREDSSMGDYAQQLEEGYSQSKWVAEQLVLRAQSRGLPVVIYRPGEKAA